ncbi:protein-disulfide reductase DsbD domain-containing protein [Anianabacter salinae]|uniref:protein-disulfide reductase DsbD domain-containing protein n=1 Tax=Anianabacter salinae TaxID=2851023 RepID=UPI00225E692C|nr:protein-disulfide reductase DsbD domain-containing protein [Anianabacter salinae]MBV0913200.1 hypothetical protein [Anianabacter salinae]
MFARILAILIAIAAVSQPVRAGGDPAPDVREAAVISILPGWRTPQGTYLAALKVALGPGWKTYWRSPGDAGIPPQFDWSQSSNIAGVDLHWPTPLVFEQNGMRTIGYAHELILPMELTPARPGALRIDTEIQIGVCQDICIPMNVRVRADLDGPGAHDPRISAALDDAPVLGRHAGVQGTSCAVEPIADGLRVRADIAMPRLGPDEVAVFEMPDKSIWISEAMSERSGPRLSAVAEMVPPSGRPFMLNRSDVRITVLSAGRAVEIDGCTGRP